MIVNVRSCGLNVREASKKRCDGPGQFREIFISITVIFKLIMKSVKLQGVIELFQFEFSSEISNVYLNLNCTDFIKIKFLFAMVFIGKRSIGKTRL